LYHEKRQQFGSGRTSKKDWSLGAGAREAPFYGEEANGATGLAPR